MVSDRTYEELYAASEDVMRLDPWERLVQPFVLKRAATPDAFVLVAFEREDSAKQVRLFSSAEGVRMWLRQDSLGDETTTGQFTRRMDGNYLEVVQDPPAFNVYEKQQLLGRDLKLVFREKRPGQPLISVTDEARMDQLLHYMKAVRKVLMRAEETPQTQKVWLQATTNFTAPAYILEDGQIVAKESFSLRLTERQKPAPPVLDEFTLARMARLPMDEDQYELFFFYLPMVTHRDGDAYYPVTGFLVNLVNGVIEWSEVLVPAPGWHETLLRKLVKFWLTREARPGRVLCAHAGQFQTLSGDFRKAQIPFEKIAQSYVGDELMASYLKMSRIKEKHFEQMNVPIEPEK